LKPNILFLVLDSLRADRIFGIPKTAKTPNIDTLIKKGNYFTKAITCSDSTTPAIQGVFSAKFPFGCGESKEKYHKIYSKNLSYLTTLKENDYHAYAVMEILLKQLGLFEPFENDDIAFETSQNLYNGLGNKIIKKFEEMIEPWFYYVHLMDLHKPCVVPDEFSHLTLSERYDKNIEEIDKWIGKILEKIDLENTLIIMMADHGEYISPYDTYMGLQDKSGTVSKFVKRSIKSLIPKSMHTTIHEKKKSTLTKIRESKMQTPHDKRMLKTRTMDHRMLFDDIVNVPLLFAGSNIQSHESFSKQVGLIDIFPTIFELINIPEKNKNVFGRSLIPLIKGKSFESIPLYIESSVVKTSIKEPKPALGIRTDSYKYFRNLHDPNVNVQLYDLKNDPLEDNNIADKNPNKIKEMEKILNDYRKNVFDQQSETDELTDAEEKELEEELKKLGYI